MSEQGRAALKQIAARLAELERKAEAAGWPMVALRLRVARAEAERRLSEENASSSSH